jgi:hypothetical protein
MKTGRFKKFLEVVFGQPSLTLEVAFGNRYELLTGVVGSLIAVPFADHYGNTMMSALLPLFATLSAFLGSFRGGLGGHSPTTIGGSSHVTWDEDGPNRRFIRSVSCYDVEQLLGSF